MKNKKFTYLLFVLVLAVWGAVIYWIWHSTQTNEDVVTPKFSMRTVKQPYDDYAITTDTTRLLLNYKDPFLIVQTDTLKSDKKPAVTKSVIAVKPLTNWSFIKYSGFIKNPGSKKQISVITINGKPAMMTEGETIDQVKLIKNLQDSVKIAYNGKTVFIKIKTAAL